MSGGQTQNGAAKAAPLGLIGKKNYS